MSARAASFGTALVLVLVGCPRPPPDVTEDDGGAPERVVYDGPTSGSGLPDLPDGFSSDASFPEIDSGVIVVDRPCCATNFSITDEEPSGEVTGTLIIGLQAFAAGVPLTRGGGRWRASACFPVNQSAPYFYQFDLDGGFVDAGAVELDDGGVSWTQVLDLRQTRRASDAEPSFEQIDGTQANVFRAVTSCDGLDGSVPR
jgi:hypothetical protein